MQPWAPFFPIFGNIQKPACPWVSHLWVVWLWVVRRHQEECVSIVVMLVMVVLLVAWLGVAVAWAW